MRLRPLLLRSWIRVPRAGGLEPVSLKQRSVPCTWLSIQEVASSSSAPPSFTTWNTLAMGSSGPSTANRSNLRGTGSQHSSLQTISQLAIKRSCCLTISCGQIIYQSYVQAGSCLWSQRITLQLTVSPIKTPKVRLFDASLPHRYWMQLNLDNNV